MNLTDWLVVAVLVLLVIDSVIQRRNFEMLSRQIDGLRDAINIKK